MLMWKVAAVLLCVAMVPAAIVSLRGRMMDRLVGLELAGTLMAQLCLIWSVAVDRPAFVDVGLAVGVLAFGGGLVFARFFERWL